MHFSLERAAGTLALLLLGGTLWVGAAALPASAQTFQDTALQAFNVTAPSPAGAVVNGTASGSGSGSTLSFTAPSGEVFASPSFTQGTTDAELTTNTAQSLVLTSKATTTTGSGTLTFTIESATSSVTCTATETVAVGESGGTLGQSSAPASVPGETVALSAVNNYTTGAVEFVGSVTVQSCTVTLSESNLPAGLTLGNPLVPGSAIPGTYGGVVYTVTDPLGSTFSGTFGLHVFGHVIVPIPTPTPTPTPPGYYYYNYYGDLVNPFGNGFDAYQQHQYPGAIVAGWTATQADPATHFILLAGTVSGAAKFEYAPHGVPSGLCVSDPGGGWASDPLPDGLILTVCNAGPWQQFIPQPNGTLKNVATGLIVSPAGTGAQLRGTTAPTPWGGSVYTWKGYSQLPV